LKVKQASRWAGAAAKTVCLAERQMARAAKLSQARSRSLSLIFCGTYLMEIEARVSARAAGKLLAGVTGALRASEVGADRLREAGCLSLQPRRVATGSGIL
jgi:hypothetical protein